MLDLPKEAMWGLFALHVLASKTRAAGAGEIARQGRIPAKRLAPILKKLRAAGLVRGRVGHGYILAKPAGSVSVHDVARLFADEKSPTVNCTERYELCAFHESCALAPLCREAWERARSAMRAFTIADLRQSPPALADCARSHFRKLG